MRIEADSRIVADSLIIFDQRILRMCVWGVRTVACTHLGNGTGRRTATLVAPLLLIGGIVKYEAVLHSCRTSPVGGDGY